MVKLAFVIPSLTIGGAEKAVSLLSTELSKIHDIYVITLRKEVRLPHGGKMYVIGKNEKLVDKISSYVSFYKLIKLLKPDVVISLLTKAHTMNALTPAEAKRYIWVQNYPLHLHFRNRLISIQDIFKWMTFYRQADKILVTSKLLAYRLTQLYKLDSKKIYLLYNPINIEEINTVKNHELDHSEENFFGDPTYINVGRLTWQKGQWHLIRAFKEVLKELKDAKLIIVGAGGMKTFLHSLIKKLDLNDNVTLYGPTLNPYRLMARSDVFVFPSIKEGFGIALVEALVCGLTVMSSDCPSGPREILAPDKPYTQQPLKEPEFAQYGILMPVPDGVFRDHTQAITKCEKIWAEWMTTVGLDKNIRRRYASIAPIRALDFDVKKICKMLLDVISM
jgi:glycosyltransferase involved in cell wall biosynthesis